MAREGHRDFLLITPKVPKDSKDLKVLKVLENR